MPYRFWGLLDSCLAAVVAVVLVFIALILAFLHFWKDTNNSSISDADDGVARARLPIFVTLGAIAFIFSVSGLTLLFAGIKAALAPDTENMKLFFEIAK
jgi:Mn2+/Fe2+ NRAMP family transporter